MDEVYFKWDARKLSTHVEAMDSEHMVLIDIMNRLYERHKDGADFYELHGLMEELRSYTVTHFDHEEQFFDTIPYREASAHKKIHQELLARLVDHKIDYEQTRQLSDGFFKFLKTWLTAHIMGIDSKYGEAALRQEHNHVKPLRR